MCECQPTVLVVEDRPRTLAIKVKLLEGQGYKVIPASSPEEALALEEESIIHLAVIDVRLRDNNAEYDLSGVELADALPKSIAKVITTAQRYADLAALIELILGPDSSGHRRAYKFVKDYKPKEIIAAVNEAFKNVVPIDPKLKITMAGGVSWEKMVDEIRMFSGKARGQSRKTDSERSRRLGAEILRDLTCRLFHEVKAGAVRFLSTSPGYSPCTVALVRPSFNGAKGIELAVKYGPSKSIDVEVDNYREWVMRYIRNSTRLEYEPASSHKMGALAYTFVGGNVKALETLREHYRDPGASDATFCDTLSHLFKETCEKWYGSRGAYSEHSSDPLDVLYREQLNLVEDEKVNALRAVMRHLVAKEPAGRQTFKLMKSGSLQVSIDGRPKFVLPDPLAFCLSRKLGTKNRGAKQRKSPAPPARDRLFPSTSLFAITHGDLHASNVIVQKGQTWMIDFFKTKVGHALRDFAELESDIKFTLFGARSLSTRYQLEKALLAPKRLDEPLVLDRPTQQQARALASIQRLRELAGEMLEVKDAREYYTALLFYALKGISGFSSASGDEHKRVAAQLHALLSAAMLCQKLSFNGPDKEGTIFLAHDYSPRYEKLVYEQLKPDIQKLKYEAVHPLHGRRPNPQLWDHVRKMIEETDAGLYEISTRNGNVYFELGYSLGVRKPYFVLVARAKMSPPNRPSLLGGELVYAYRSQPDLKAQVRRIIKGRADWNGFFFLRPEFKRGHSRTPKRKIAMLLVADTRRQRAEFKPELARVLEECGWAVEFVQMEREVNIQKFYTKLSKAGLVVGCLASDRAAHARQANAEVALALGISHGMQKKTIILQEEECKVLTDLKSLTVTFRGVEGAVEILSAELSGVCKTGRARAKKVARPKKGKPKGVSSKGVARLKKRPGASNRRASMKSAKGTKRRGQSRATRS